MTYNLIRTEVVSVDDLSIIKTLSKEYSLKTLQEDDLDRYMDLKRVHVYQSESNPAHYALIGDDGLLVNFNELPDAVAEVTEDQLEAMTLWNGAVPERYDFLSFSYPNHQGVYVSLKSVMRERSKRANDFADAHASLVMEAKIYFHDLKIGKAKAALKELVVENGAVNEPVQEVMKAKEMADVIENAEDETITRLRTIRKARSADLPTFMNTEGAYTMREYVYALKSRLTGNAFNAIMTVAKSLTDNDAKELFNAQAKYKVLDVMFGERTKFVEAVEGLALNPIVKDARLPDEVTPPDATTARIPQSAEKSKIYFKIGQMTPSQASVAYLNLYDRFHKINVIPKSKHMAASAQSVSRITEAVRSYVETKHRNYLNMVPMPPRARTEYTNTDLYVMSNLKVAKNRADPTVINLVVNTHGQRLFTNFSKTLDVSVLARVVANGLQDVDLLHQAYKSSDVFRSQWQEVLKVFGERHKTTHDAYEQYINGLKELVSLYQFRRFGLEVLDPKLSEDRIINCRKIIEEAHEANRKYIVANGNDRRAIVHINHALDLFPTDSFFCTVMNDILFADTNLTVNNALDFVNVGHLRSTDNHARPQDYPDEPVSYQTSWLDKFDANPNPREGKIDMRFVKGSLYYVGGETTLKDKLTRREKETRSALYYDLEPDPIEVRGNERVYPAVLREEDAQYQHAVKILEGPENVIGVIVPLRWLADVIEKYPVQFMYPAPFPAVMSVYVIVDKARKCLFNFKHVALLASINYSKQLLMFNMVENGMGVMVDVFDEQSQIESQENASVILTRWWMLLRDRFAAKAKGSALKTVTEDVRLLLKSDEKAQDREKQHQLINAARDQSAYLGFKA